MSKVRKRSVSQEEKLENDIKKFETEAGITLEELAEKVNNIVNTEQPTKPLEEWDLEDNPVPLPPLCDVCGEDATHGQNTEQARLCPTCCRKS